VVDWGEYAAAIRRWETILGRPAPYPTEPGRAGRPRLAAAFVEWLMGLPDGWVTAIPGVSRAAQIRALGNGVVPAQAAAAVTLLLADLLADQTPAGADEAAAA
jgi:DNA (cytosine-5)-methyltransferase 1